MRQTALRLALGVLFLTLLLVGLVVTIPGRRGVFVGLYELAVGAVVVWALVRRLRSLDAEPDARSPFERRPEDVEEPAATADLDRIDRLVVLGAASSFDFHYRLRPLLRELASAKLHADHGIELDHEPERARRLLGDEVWRLVRRDRELENRAGPGLPPADLERLVTRLEAL
jgi:hypothetical protein